MSELLCVCESAMWLLQVTVDGDLKDEALLDVTFETAVQAADELSDRHMAIVNEAIELGLPWTVSMRCPTCQGGTLVTSVDGQMDIVGSTES